MKKLLIFISTLLIILSISCNNTSKNIDFGEIYENNYINQWIGLKFKTGNGWESISYDLLDELSFPNEHVNLIGIESKKDVECVNGLGREKQFLEDEDILYGRPYGLTYNDEASVILEIFKLKNVDEILKTLEERFTSSSYVMNFKLLENEKSSIKEVEFHKISVEVDYGFPEKLYMDCYTKEVNGFFILIMANHYNETEDALNDFLNNNIELL